MLDQSLIQLLQRVNAAARAGSSRISSRDDESAAQALLGQAEKRLAVYGSLAPGEPNHFVIEHLRGEWVDGFVRGTLSESGWGSGIGYPAITWDWRADPIPVRMFVSSELPEHWRRLDEFEGAEYIRILVPVEDVDGELVAAANIYAAARANSQPDERRNLGSGSE